MKRPTRKVIKQSAVECMEALIEAHEQLFHGLTAQREYYESIADRSDHIGKFLREVESIILDGTEVIE